MQFEVKAAGVTHRVSVPVAPPQGGGGGLAVCAAGACASGGRLEETEKYVVNNDQFMSQKGQCGHKKTFKMASFQAKTEQPQMCRIQMFFLKSK